MNLSEIQQVIESLPQDQQTALASWMAERDRIAWDAELEKDFSPGGAGIKWLESVKTQIRDGKSRPLTEGPSQS